MVSPSDASARRLAERFAASSHCRRNERLKVVYRPLAVAKIGVIRILRPLSGGCDVIIIIIASASNARDFKTATRRGTRSTMPGTTR